MVNNCNICDVERIIELGKLINSDFDKINNIKEIIDKGNIIGYYENNKVVGFIIFENIYEVMDILYIVVDPIFRRNGIGSILMEYLLENKDYERIMLEVRCDNSNAIKLYKKYNFKIINIRKNYYMNNDAYVMEMRK